jgi:hypothetical protein
MMDLKNKKTSGKLKKRSREGKPVLWIKFGGIT